MNRQTLDVGRLSSVALRTRWLRLLPGRQKIRGGYLKFCARHKKPWTENAQKISRYAKAGYTAKEPSPDARSDAEREWQNTSENE